MRLQKLSDAITAIEKNLENLKETLEELKGKSLTGSAKLEVKENSIPLDVMLESFISALVEQGVDYFYNRDDEYNSSFIFRKILQDKEYGLKAILLLWDATDRYAGATSILYRVFPWVGNETLEDWCEEGIFTIEDWLIENYNTEMTFSFLNKELKKLDKGSRK